MPDFCSIPRVFHSAPGTENSICGFKQQVGPDGRPPGWVNPPCLLKMLRLLEMTFGPDGGAGAKVREQLKSSGTVLWGAGGSTLNVIPICLVLGERESKKREKSKRLACLLTIGVPQHLCNIYTVLVGALGRWATSKPTAATLVCAGADTLADGRRGKKQLIWTPTKSRR